MAGPAAADFGLVGGIRQHLEDQVQRSSRGHHRGLITNGGQVLDVDGGGPVVGPTIPWSPSLLARRLLVCGLGGYLSEVTRRACWAGTGLESGFIGTSQRST